MSIVFKIEKLREAKKLSKTDLAEKIGVNRDTVYNWTDENIKVSTLMKISDILGVDMQHFLIDKKENISKIVSKQKAKVVFELSANDVLSIDIKNKKLEILKK